MPKIIANLNLVCWESPKGGLEMAYDQPEYAEQILPEHKKTCAAIFDIVKNSFEFGIAMAAKQQGATRQ